MIEKLFEKDKRVLTYGTVTALSRHLSSAVIQTSDGVNLRVVYPKTVSHFTDANELNCNS